MSDFSIEIRNLRRVFRLDRMARKQAGKILTALDDINLQVRRGEIIGLLGPNGAGKTTLIRILATLLTPSSGEAFIEGYNVQRDLTEVRKLINMVSGGETCGYGILTAAENLRLFTELYGIPWKVARPRVEKMLKVVGLDRYQGVRVNKLSTGMRQRVNFARGFTTDPKVLFLDEPTVGLDVHSALDVRRFIKLWMTENPTATILLTTHYMAEADELCDRVAIIDRGAVQACDSPKALKYLVQKETALDLLLSGVETPPQTWERLPGVVKLTSELKPDQMAINLRVLLESAEAGGHFIHNITSDGRRLLALHTVEPSLEDVFIKLTGRRLSAAEELPEERAQ
ncbi:MAG: ABC transporter ATP-binding protein [Calditrichota bacterium]